MAVWDGKSLAVARALVGSVLVTIGPAGRTSVIITEAEAYGGADDPASHAFRGRTERNAPMFARAGTIYVYRSYGLHWCLNVVTGGVGDAQAVLVRAGEPGEGRSLMEERRGRSDHLADGPGKLTAALGIDGWFDGKHLEELDNLTITPPGRPVTVDWKPRVGLTRAPERPWRCVLTSTD